MHKDKNMIKLYFLGFDTFIFSKDTDKKMNWEARDWEKLFV